MAIESTDIELKKWGKFFGDGGSRLGFPTSSPETKAIEGRGGRQCEDGYVPADIQATEDAVRAMTKKFPELGVVAKEFYMTGHSSDVMALRLTKRLGRNISRTKVFDLVDRVHHCVAMHMA